MKEMIELELSGGKILRGTIVEKSAEIIVLFEGEHYKYIFADHIRQLKLAQVDDIEEILEQSTSEKLPQASNELTRMNILNLAMDKQLEIFVAGNQSVYGAILAMKNDYIVFYSPVYKTMYISIKHIKWLVPYIQPVQLYGLHHIELPKSFMAADSLQQQIVAMKDQLVIINNGEKTNYIGKVLELKDNMLELQTANSIVFVHVDHIKTLHGV